MAASYATDVGGGSHHDALLSLRDLPSFQDKYTVECVEARLSFFRLLRPERRRRLTSPRPRRPRPRRPRPLLPRYLWLGGCGGDLRSKTKTLEGPIRGLQDLPKWNYDGSSTNQAPGIDSEVVLVPRAVFRDPFRATPRDRLIGDETAGNRTTPAMNGKAPASSAEAHTRRGPAQAALESARAAIFSAPSETPAQSNEDAPPILDGCRNLLVMCDTYTPAGRPIPTNTRARAERVFSDPLVAAEECWYGIEQEYTLLDATTKWPVGWPNGGFPAPQGPYYCGVGADRMFGRHIAESHYRACHYAGVNIGGLNAEVMPGQWEYQIGPCVGIDAGDHLWVARYILQRVCELTGTVVVTLDPKPVEGDWNGAGAHTNFSTRSMRHAELGGMQEIERAICRLKDRHDEHIAAYGEGNEKRLTGLHETASICEFTWGVADRGASIRVGNDTYRDGCGYMEDRRPSANCDPYVVTSMLAETTLAVSETPLLPVPEEIKDDAPGAKRRHDDVCFPGIERLDIKDDAHSGCSSFSDA